MAESVGNCSRCGQPMIEHRFVRHYVQTCNNPGCPLRRGPQGYREIAIELGAITASMPAPLTNTVSPPKGRKKKKSKEG